MKLFALFGALALAAGASPAAASPTFRSDGPNAEAYGAAEGYPVGRATAGRFPQRFMVGSFSHYDTLLRTREVRRGGPVSELRRADPDLELTYLYDGAPRTLADYVDRNPVTGLLIAKGDTILFEHYQYGRTDRHRFVSQSMAKTVTAMLIGIAVAEGKIASIEDRVERYVPGLAGTEYGGTALRSLLTMSSGVLFREDYDGTTTWPGSAATSSGRSRPGRSRRCASSTPAPRRPTASSAMRASRPRFSASCCTPPSARRSPTTCRAASGSRSAPRPTPPGRSTAPSRKRPFAASRRCCGTMPGSA